MPQQRTVKCHGTRLCVLQLYRSSRQAWPGLAWPGLDRCAAGLTGLGGLIASAVGLFEAMSGQNQPSSHACMHAQQGVVVSIMSVRVSRVGDGYWAGRVCPPGGDEKISTSRLS